MKFKASLVLIAVATLSACVSSAPRRLPPQQASLAPQGVEGNWADPTGIVSTFQGGTMTTRASDGSNAVLASGTYVTQPSGLIEITLYSNLKKTTSRSNCSLVTPSQLNCTQDSGAQFSLTRRL